MNKDDVNARIATIRIQMEQLKANYAKLEGHLGECAHWLAEIEKAESKEQVDGEVDSKDAGEAA